MCVQQRTGAPQSRDILAVNDSLVDIDLECLSTHSGLLNVIVKGMNVCAANAIHEGLRLLQVRVAGVLPEHSGVLCSLFLLPAVPVGCVGPKTNTADDDSRADDKWQ